jgi:hypothetical protein|tara:strand:+ start:307 stop:984 length:678 start_codon:yes stop_codon:yes gene_type:complete
MKSTFWINDPTILLKKENIASIWPLREMNTNEKLNAITRLVIILTLLGFLITKTIKILVTGIVTLLAIVILYKAQLLNNNDKIKSNPKEAFTNPEIYKMIKHNFTQPSKKNPAMNVLLTDINDNPKREAAAPAFNPIVKDEINKSTQDFVADNFDDPKISDKLFKDLGDSFTFDQSMRTWYATANTRVPNDQKAFSEYCYGDMVSCKEGNEFACAQSMPPRWTNN